MQTSEVGSVLTSFVVFVMAANAQALWLFVHFLPCVLVILSRKYRFALILPVA